MKTILFAIGGLLTLLPGAARAATADASQAVGKIKACLPGKTNFADIKAKRFAIDNAARTIRVDLNEAATYIPFTSTTLENLKKEIAEAYGLPGYNVVLTAAGRNLDDLVLFAEKVNRGPSENTPFVRRAGADAAPKGLDGANIALWQSHGWYFEPKLNRWEWQRARIFQTVEDLYTQSYVMPFLMPMLENAGAYVMSPRERDTNLTEIVVDNDGMHTSGTYAENGGWGDAGSGFGAKTPTLRNNQNPFAEGSARKSPLSGHDNANAKATWSADIPEAGNYAVYVSYKTLPNSTTEAHYTVNAADGSHEITVNQRMGGGTWIYLGHFPLEAGMQAVVELDNRGADRRRAVSADAVKIGGGMGHVERIVKVPLDSIDYQYTASGYPRFVEGARYFLQYAGAPDSVYTPTDNVNDYNDDYRSRGLWVNWLAGGSSMLPEREGLGVPVDLSFAFHTDAGTTLNDSIIGSLGIYSTAGDVLGNGSTRMASRDLTDLVLSNITDDVRAQFEPNWTRRGMWDKSYFEARVPEVPAMLLELLSHQNFADMKYGLDPEFRFAVSRAIYKGMLEFIAHRDGREFVVQPLAPGGFAISKTGVADYRLSWRATPDSLEASAMPAYYLVQQRDGSTGNAFHTIARVEHPEYTYTATDSDIHSFRIVAGNDGGVSFPSEVLALRHVEGEAQPVVIVNGFTRISAPDWFDSGEIAGFYDVRDHGVPYVKDISFIGSQFEFRRDIPWMDDDAAGFGASRADYEDRVVAGNTFDFVALHGEAVAAAGRGFVSESLEAFCSSAVRSGADLDLILGKQKESAKGRGVYGTRYKAFPSALQRKLREHTAAGGSVFVSGAYVATDIWDNPFSSPETAEADKAFAREVLGYAWRVGQATVEGAVYEVPTRFKAFTGGDFAFSCKLNDECYAVESPDSFYASDKDKGCTLMRYSENNLVAATAYDAGAYRTVVLGFPFETISTPDARASLMKQVLNFFTKK